MVEFAIILPFLLMMVFGIVEFGHMLMTFNNLNKAAQDAARYLIDQQPGTGGTKYQDMVTAHQATATNLMTCGRPTCASATLLNPAPCSGGANSCTFSASNTGLITVTISYPYQPIFNHIFGTNIVPSNFVLHSTAVMQSIL